MTDRSGQDEIDALFREYRRTGRRALRNRLVNAHAGLAGHIAKDYAGRSVEYDDLRQVALIGMVKSVERWDPERGVPFSAFASRTVNGELKRYFRDRTWAVRPPRGMQELAVTLSRVTNELTQSLGRAPTVNELAEATDASEDEILEALEARTSYRASSLDAPRPGAEDDGAGSSLGDRMATSEGGFAQTERELLSEALLSKLGAREAEIVRLRFWEDLTQSEIAERIGISQMHVSRLLRRALRDLRARLDAAGS